MTNPSMPSSRFGRAPYRFMIIQLLLLGGLAAFEKFGIPRLRHQSDSQAAAAREQKTNALFQDSVEEDARREISVPLGGKIVKRHPQRLRATFSPQEAEATLGVPTTSTTDFRGGQHLTWLGTDHQLTASFNAGRLYCLAREDRATRHGVMVFESPWAWHPY